MLFFTNSKFLIERHLEALRLGAFLLIHLLKSNGFFRGSYFTVPTYHSLRDLTVADLLGVLGVLLVHWRLLGLHLPEVLVFQGFLHLHYLLVFPVVVKNHTTLLHVKLTGLDVI